MHVQQLTPASVAQPRSLLGGANNVSEQHGGQHPRGLGDAADTGDELLDLVQDKLGRLPDDR
jgi:hypothetical protein